MDFSSWGSSHERNPIIDYDNIHIVYDVLAAPLAAPL
jgi:hypothetical protein